MTEQIISVIESPILIPSLSGGRQTVPLRRAGFLKKLRFHYTATLNVTAFTSAPSRSAFGVLGGGISRLRVEANGKIPLFDLTGKGLVVWTEIQNRDGTLLTLPSAKAQTYPLAADFTSYPAISGTGTVTVTDATELNFMIPVYVRGILTELGLVLLQNEALDIGVEVVFNPLYSPTVTNDALYSGGTLTVSMGTPSQLEVERESYTVPSNPRDFPDTRWVHQVLEFNQPISGGFFRFEVPRAGLLLRAVIRIEDAAGAPVELAGSDRFRVIYGANEVVVDRFYRHIRPEYVFDYSRLPPRGVAVIDFYKWGFETLRLAKNTEVLANLAIEGTVASGAMAMITLERLMPVVAV
ncbi:hypothetical protein [Chloroflexus sp.]|uniref:hypothetical protein n=1 Tax=Chloroflexus sp. TaxID=1904827 RepID=UPI002ACE94C2|nr:hypothetical protein [Chloroflexus sp.]